MLTTKEKQWFSLVLALLVGAMADGVLSAHLWPATGTAIAATRHTKVLKAERFELVGPDGSNRGVLHVTRNGTAAIGLYDASGKSRAELTVEANGNAAVAFFDSSGSRRAVLGGTQSAVGQ